MIHTPIIPILTDHNQVQMMTYSWLTCALLFSTSWLSAQTKSLQTTLFLPEDSARYEKRTGLPYNVDKDKYGNTQLVIHSEAGKEQYEFVFTKKVRQLDRIIDYKNGESIYQTYDRKAGKWEYGANSRREEDIRSSPTDTSVISNHDLYAFIMLQDHGGTVEKAAFKDFGNEVYWPEFEYAFCSVSDEDRNGKPEFYLSYMGYSDGLDAKPFKQIIYTPSAEAERGFIKSKATAYYPVAEEEDRAGYYVAYDANWLVLPEAIRKKSRRLLKEHQQQYPK
jgi:hypothetical protein